MGNAGTRIALAMTAACLAASATSGAMFQPAPLNVYFGSLSAYGVDARESGRPGEEFERARIVEGMDFLAVTTAPRKSVVPAITASLNARLDGRFVAMYGWRYGTSSYGSHVSVLEPSTVDDERNIPDGRYDLFYRSWLPQQTDTMGNVPILQFAESRDPAVDYGRPDVDSIDSLRAITAPYVRTIQIAGRAHSERAPASVSDSRARAYLDYLNAGFRIAPTADSEGAWRTGAGEYRTAVLAGRLTKPDILESIRARHVYATDDDNLRVSFSINHSAMGSVVPMPPGTPLRIELTLSDADEPNASYWISLRRDTPGGEPQAALEFSGTDFKGDGTVVFTQFRHAAGEEYFLAHIVQGSGDGADHVWTAPIWLVSPGQDSSPSSGRK